LVGFLGEIEGVASRGTGEHAEGLLAELREAGELVTVLLVEAVVSLDRLEQADARLQTMGVPTGGQVKAVRRFLVYFGRGL
jgi:hypothetical protein